MKRSLKSTIRLTLLLLLAGVAAAVTLRVTRTTDAQAACSAALDTAWTQATDVCVNKPVGFICNGGSAPLVEPQGAVSNALANLGALVDVNEIDALRTPPIAVETGTLGVAWLRLPPPTPVTGLLVGDVMMRNTAAPDFPKWQSFVVQTGVAVPACENAPHNALVLQTPPGQAAPLVVNGLSLTLSGSVMIYTDPANTIFIGLSGQSTLAVAGFTQRLWTGQQVIVPYDSTDFSRPIGAPFAPTPYTDGILDHLPMSLLDVPLLIPQPGNVVTQGDVNLRVAPSVNAAVITQVPPGQVLPVLGANPDGDWYHVQLAEGTTGWLFGDLLARNGSAVAVTYEATPMLPQRLGELGSRGRVLAPAGANLRRGPHITFPVTATLSDGTLVDLVARSPYSPWIKVQSEGAIGWLAVISIDTNAYVEAIPVDFSAPPPPTPTPIPGSFGNAIPDLVAPGN